MGGCGLTLAQQR